MMLTREQKEKIEALRRVLLELHTALLSFEKKKFESLYGRIEESNQYLGIVLNHPAFQWLKSLSAIITAIDEGVDSDEEDVNPFTSIFIYIENLLFQPLPTNPFASKYLVALQKDPDVILAHKEVKQIYSEAKKIVS